VFGYALSDAGSTFQRTRDEWFFIANLKHENGADGKVLSNRVEYLRDAPVSPRLKTLKARQYGLTRPDAREPIRWNGWVHGAPGAEAGSRPAGSG
jgi:hypothetical protein